MKFKKFAVIFFALLLLLIWCTHVFPGKKEVAEKKVEPPLSVNKIVKEPIVIYTARNVDQKLVQFHKRLRALLATTQSPKNPKLEDDPADFSEKSIYDLSERTNLRLIASPTDRFFVNDKKCQVPFADPFSRDVMELFYKVDLKKCSNESDIISVIYDQKLKRYKVHVHTDAMVKIAPNITKFSCHYREFVNKNKDPYIT